MPNKTAKNARKESLVLRFSHLKGWRWYRMAILIGADVGALAAAFLTAFWLRFDRFIPPEYSSLIWNSLVVLLLISLPIFSMVGMYRQVWRYANSVSAVLIARSVLFSAMIFSAITLVTYTTPRIPRSIYLIYTLLALFFITLIRFSWRVFVVYSVERRVPSRSRCLIYGAGMTGDILARSIGLNHDFPY